MNKINKLSLAILAVLALATASFGVAQAVSVNSQRPASIITDDTAGWTAANPILRNFEVGIDTTSGEMRAGDGVNRWLDLPVIPRGTSGGGGGGTSGDFVALATTTLDTDTMTVTFNTVPGGYRDLQIRIVGWLPSSSSNNDDVVTMRADMSTTQDYQNVNHCFTNATGTDEVDLSNATSATYSLTLGKLGKTQNYGGMITTDIGSYTASGMRKPVASRSVNSSPQGVAFYGDCTAMGFINHNNAITALSFSVTNKFAAGTTITLYGVGQTAA